MFSAEISQVSLKLTRNSVRNCKIINYFIQHVNIGTDKFE